MSIFKIRYLAFAVALGGCEAALVPSETGPGFSGAVLVGDVTVQGPQGYCVDPTTVQQNLRTTAVTFFSCDRLNDPDGADATEGRMFTATALPGQITDRGDFADYLKSDAGRQLLSTGGTADTVTVHRTRQSQSAVYVEFSDTGVPEHLGQRQWRGFVPVKNQIVVIALYQGANDPISGSKGERALRDFAEKVVQANASAS